MFGEHAHDRGCDMDWILGGDRVHEAVLLMEGFDHMIASLVTAKGWSVNPSSMQTGRFAGQCARMGTTISTKAVTASATLIAGFALRASAWTSTTDMFFIRAGATNAVRFSLNGSNIIQIRNSGGTVVATGTTPLLTNTWYYIEIKAFQSGASGTVEVKLNGVSEIASTTANIGSTNLDSVGIIGVSGNTTDFDDIYVVDTTGAAPRNTFLGDVRVVTVMPNADGAHAQWTPSSGANHFDRVNELTGTFPDGDTTYVSDSTPGHYDTFVVDDVDAGATVLAVQTNLYARKDDAATRQIAPVVRQSSTDHDGTTVTLGSTYQFQTQVWNQDGAGSDWTASSVNAAEFGVKEVA